MSAALLALIGGLLAVPVQGSTGCPTAAAVEARLRPLMPAQSAGGTSVVRLHRESAALHISLLTVDGQLLAWRSLDVPPAEGPQGCQALAEAAAVIVAAWHSDVGGRSLLTDGRAGEAGLATSLPEAPVVAASGAWGMAVGGGVSLAGRAPAPAALVSFVHAPWPEASPAAPWAGRLAIVYQAARERALPDGRLGWQRWLLEVGPQLQGGAGTFGWELHLGLVGALTRLQGKGLADARMYNDAGWGLSAGGRLSLGRRGPRPFLDLTVRGSPTRVVGYQGGAAGETGIPRLDVMLTLGAAIGR